jgi:DNA-binding MarR family transcriptional regulator
MSEVEMPQSKQSDIEKIRISKKNDPNLNLYILLHQTQSLIANAVETELKGIRVTQPQVILMTMLSRENRPLTLDELANWSLKDFSSVFTLVNRMEKKGLVKKVKNNGDNKTYVTLTKQGSLLYHQKVTERSIQLIFDRLSPEEKKQLDSILKTMREYTREILGLAFRPPFLP